MLDFYCRMAKQQHLKANRASKNGHDSEDIDMPPIKKIDSIQSEAIVSPELDE